MEVNYDFGQIRVNLSSNWMEIEFKTLF